MKTSLWKYLFVSFFIFISCETEEPIEDFWLDAQVVGEGIDCHSNWRIKDVNNTDADNSFGIFSEIGLPEEYKVENLNLRLKLREAEAEEVPFCTTLGVAYPFRVVLEVQEK